MLPFFRKYPYTNLKQINLDRLFDDVTTMKAEVDECITKVNGMESRVTKAEEDIDSLETRMGTAEGDIDSLETRMGTAEGDIDSLETRMGTAEGDISSLTSRVTSTENSISDLEDRTTANEGNINSISSDISDLEAEVDNIPVVVANPGGTGSNLNSISIDGTTYVVPSGGGGGGSSVTPNPSGTPTDDLNTVDIDGTIYAIAGGGTTVVANPGGLDNPDLTSISIGGSAYDIPVTDVSGIISDISALDTRMGTAEDDIDALEASTAFLANGIGTANMNIAKTVTSLDNSDIDSDNTLTLTPGTYLLIAWCQTIGNNRQSNLSSGMHVRNALIGLETADRASILGYDSNVENTTVINVLPVMVTLSSNTTITLRTKITVLSSQITSCTLYDYIKYIKLR